MYLVWCNYYEKSDMMHDVLHNMHDALQPETLWTLTFQQPQPGAFIISV